MEPYNENLLYDVTHLAKMCSVYVFHQGKKASALQVYLLLNDGNINNVCVSGFSDVQN